MKYSFLLFTIALASSCPSSSLAFTFVPKAQRCFSSSLLHMADTSSRAVVTRLPDSAVEIIIPVPGSATKAAYDKVAAELSKSIAVPGFRKGSKIPPQVLEQAMSAKGGRNALKVQAINELLRELVEPTLKQENLDPIGQATLLTPAETLAESYVPGQDITLPVRCDVWPEIKFSGPYTGLKGSYTRKPFDQDKLEKALFDLKERYATLENIEDASYALQMGDACTVNMEGYMGNADGSKGEPLPNAASGDNVEVILGPGRYMEGLVEGLVGAKVGETRTVSVAFPEKLRDKSLAGKRAIFDVEVLQAAKRVVPELTDEFAAQVKAGLTKESLLKELRKAIDEDDAKEFLPARNKALGEALAEIVQVSVPDTLVTNQAREKFAVMMADMRDNGVADAEIKRQINPENFAKYKDIVKDDIIRDFKVSMATDEIGRLEGITVPEYQVEEQMQSIQKDMQKGEEYDENMIRARVQATLERQAVMNWLADKADLEVIEKTEEQFDADLMEKLAQESLEREQRLAAKLEASAAQDAVVEPATQASSTENVAEKKFEDMTLEEKAFQALIDAGAVKPSDDPSSPDYDHSTDNEIAS